MLYKDTHHLFTREFKEEEEEVKGWSKGGEGMMMILFWGRCGV